MIENGKLRDFLFISTFVLLTVVTCFISGKVTSRLEQRRHDEEAAALDRELDQIQSDIDELEKRVDAEDKRLDRIEDQLQKMSSKQPS
jgi:septal ring factor EnvC (AmiA/AmiB activator)